MKIKKTNTTRIKTNKGKFERINPILVRGFKRRFLSLLTDRDR